MKEVTKTQLPLLAWRYRDGKFILIYDDNAVGELTLDDTGRGAARYHESEWNFEPAGGQLYRMRDGKSRRLRGAVQFDPVPGEPDRAQEGRITLNGKTYRCLSDPHKIPPRVTITGPENQPLLQFRAEEEGRGKIQVDNMQAAASPQFERLVLWGLYLYLMAERQNLREEAIERRALVRPDSTPRIAEIVPAATSSRYLESATEPQAEPAGMANRYAIAVAGVVAATALSFLLPKLVRRVGAARGRLRVAA